MTPEQWQRVFALVKASEHCDERQRASFLAASSSNDEEILKAARSLLVAQQQMGSFLEASRRGSGTQLNSEMAAKTEQAAPTDETVPFRSRDWPSLSRGATLGRYVVHDLLGKGGMGVVYVAYDPELHRKVALKLLHPELSSVLQQLDGRARLLREAQAMARLSHPNVVVVHDVGTFHEDVFIAMEYVDGCTLREWLEAEPRSWPDIVDIFIQAGRGLSAAHAAGIVHRDFKPENVLVGKDGRARVVDFGLARGTISVEASETIEATGDEISAQSIGATPLSSDVTKTGLLIGTPAYMAPEQIYPGAVDARTDQFSFCVALYQALYRELPFGGDNLRERLAAIQEGGLKIVQPSTPMPEPIREAIARGLAANPDARWPSIDLLLDALEKGRSRPERLADSAGETSTSITVAPASRRRHRAIVLGGALLACLSAAGLYSYLREGPINSLVVLPFENAGAEETDYFTDGITENIINELSQLSQVQVIARPTAFTYKGKKPNFKQLNEDLHVRAALIGKVHQEGDTLTIQVDLIDLARGSELWGDRYTRKRSDIFMLQEQVTKEITEKLRVRLSGSERERLSKRYTSSLAAYDKYLQGRFSWNQRTRESLNKAISYFEEAIALDPTYALPYAGVADSYSLLVHWMHLAPREGFPKARTAALKAIELDPELAEAHTSLAYIQFSFDWDFREAEKEFRRALSLNPNYATAHHWYSRYLLATGHQSEAIKEAKLARDLDPRSPVMYLNVAMVLYEARRYDEAIAEARKLRELAPQQPCHYDFLAYYKQGRSQEAIGLAQGKRELAMLERILKYPKAETLEFFNKMKFPEAGSYTIAGMYSMLEEKEEALKWLEKAYARHDDKLVFLRVEPMFDPIRFEPGFIDLVRRMNFP